MSKDIVLGIGVQGPIIPLSPKGQCLLKDDQDIKLLPVPNAIECLWEINGYLNGQVHLLTKCGGALEERIKKWLRHSRFHEKTGIPGARIHYCNSPQDHHTACRAQRITHLLDTHLSVVGTAPVIQRYLLFGPQDWDVQFHAQYLNVVNHYFPNWLQFKNHLFNLK